MEGYGKLKIGRKATFCGWQDPIPRSKGQRSKVKVTRPINAVTENQPHVRTGKAYELQTWYTDGV